jgi:predicted MPP superfamily phosphohydrolase
VLAGHTHGGQCRLPYFGAPIVPIRNRRYTIGEVALTGGRRLYVNRGLGYTHQVRFNCTPEITVFRLTAASA